MWITSDMRRTKRYQVDEHGSKVQRDTDISVSVSHAARCSLFPAGKQWDVGHRMLECSRLYTQYTASTRRDDGRNELSCEKTLL